MSEAAITVYVKLKEIVSDSAAVTACVIGVGFLSGSEATYYWGSFRNVAVFCVCFFALHFLFRETRRKQGAAYMRVRNNALVAFACEGCKLTCAVSLLACFNQCIARAIAPSDLPLYSAAAALICGVLYTKTPHVFKILNVLSLLLAALFLLLVLPQGGGSQSDAPLWRPAVYALFTASATFTLTDKLHCKSKKDNAAGALLTCAVLGALMCLLTFCCDFRLSFPAIDFTRQPAGAVGCAAVVVSTLCSLKELSAQAFETAEDITGDRALSASAVLCLEMATSLLGFDVLLKYGYLFAAAVGFALCLACLVCTTKNRPEGRLQLLG